MALLLVWEDEWGVTSRAHVSTPDLSHAGGTSPCPGQPEVSPDLLSIFLETKPPPAENPNSNPVNYKLLRKTHIAEKI